MRRVEVGRRVTRKAAGAVLFNLLVVDERSASELGSARGRRRRHNRLSRPLRQLCHQLL